MFLLGSWFIVTFPRPDKFPLACHPYLVGRCSLLHLLVCWTNYQILIKYRTLYGLMYVYIIRHIIYHLRIGYSYNKHYVCIYIYICYFDHCTPSTCPLGSVNWPMKKRSGSLKAGVYGGGFISASSVLFQIWMVGQFTGNPFKYYEMKTKKLIKL